jgi:hypothetical protein
MRGGGRLGVSGRRGSWNAIPAYRNAIAARANGAPAGRNYVASP